MKTQNRIFTMLLISVSLLLSACYNKTETTEVTPAQLELVWEQSIAPDSSQNFRNTIPTEMAQQLRQIGEYSSSVQISFSQQTAKAECKIRFSKEIKSTEVARLLPLLKSIFKEKAFRAIFHGEQQKHVTQVKYGVFGRTTSGTIHSYVAPSTKILAQSVPAESQLKPSVNSD